MAPSEEHRFLLISKTYLLEYHYWCVNIDIFGNITICPQKTKHSLSVPLSNCKTSYPPPIQQSSIGLWLNISNKKNNERRFINIIESENTRLRYLKAIFLPIVFHATTKLKGLKHYSTVELDLTQPR